ncbi:MAG: Hsp20/alpha crystallin family protein, partial [Desulfobacterales bacterium]|nr:Hsp20/alpha crystallin family protein [Desulfobacterales bacterium]
ITGLRRETARVPGIKYHLAEIVYGKFERILLLPLPINPEEVKASYTNGLLKVTMPKSLSKEARQIPIQGE